MSEDLTDEEKGYRVALNTLRLVQQHHVRLSEMADQKASILIGASLVTFTLIIGQGHRLGMSFAILILALTAFCSAILAVLTVLPKVTKSRDPGPGANMLFFGNFTALDEESYQTYMAGLLADEQSQHRALVRDIYQLGSVLQSKKYFYLAYAYRVFIGGMVIALITFLMQALGYLPKTL